MTPLELSIEGERSHDVVVVGSGAGGWSAALAAARAGANTLLVERRGHMGGTSASGLSLLGFHNNDYERVVGGIAHELVEELVAAGGSTGYELTPMWHNSLVPVDPVIIKSVILGLLEDAGVELLLHAQIIGVEVLDGQITGVVCQKKSGRELVRAAVFVDASGDAEVAHMAGAPTQRGKGETHEMQPPTLLFRIGNVNERRLRDYLKAHPDEFANWRMKPGEAVTPEFLEVTDNFLIMPRLLDEARATGEYDSPIDRIMFALLPNSRDVLVNMLRGYRVDGRRSESMTEAVRTLRRGLVPLFQFIKRHVPGFEDAFLADADTEVLLRETRRIVGHYVLTADDVLDGRQFDDSIGVGAYYIDIHNPDDPHASCRMIDHPYGIPYRCLVPLEVEGLLAAGRCISMTHEAAGSARVMAQCMAMGQAAGVGAALCVEQQTVPSDLDPRALRQRLLEARAILDWPPDPGGSVESVAR